MECSVFQYASIRQQLSVMKEARESVASFIGSSLRRLFYRFRSEATNTVLSILACPARQCSFPGQVNTTSDYLRVIEPPLCDGDFKCLSDRSIEVK